MKSIDEAEAQARLDEVLEEAQRQPVVIRREGADYAIVLSMRE
ncbi:MAG: type II toxin-antitoxin system Phd/YefM family antitoxin, partial [Acidobacteria bacterium]|nr:type II toxin-antitoxin system Phd/YefM family antitoxin [Acidobacteriota bacterium]